MSESLKVGTVSAIAGGFMDAYSYVCRGNVFANAQTGNMLLVGLNIYEKNWSNVFKYILPILSFAVGIMLCEYIRWKIADKNNKNIFHWRQVSVLVEMIFLVIVCFIPQSYNLIANSITSMACGIQLECFRKIHGNGVATTMCIGNLRCATENFCKFIERRDICFLKKSLFFLCIILFFVIGAVVGNCAVLLMNEYALLLCSFVLFSVFLIMFEEEN